MTERASGPSLSLVGVGHSFSGSSELFCGLDLTLRAGEVVAVVGPSGSGKSTVLHLVAGWEVPTSGYVSRDGVHSIAWVFQNPHGSTWRTALDHVVLPLLAAGADRPRAEIEAMAILERYDLSAVASRPFRHLSGGEAQRLMLARAVATAPDLLLVDEPTAQLDPLTASSLVRTLGGIADGGRIVVVATHDPQVWAACTQVIDLGTRSQDRLTLTTSKVAEEREPAGRQRERRQPVPARRGAGSVEDGVPAHSEGDCLGSRPRSRAQGWLGGMRPGAVLSEARRDLVSGSARAATWAAAAALVLGLVAAVDARTTVALMSEAEAFRASGASIQVLDAAGGVDATQCEALSQVDGIVSAGALRATSENVTPLALPSSELRVVEASPGLAQVLGVGNGRPDGVWLPDSVATTLDLHAGRALLTTDGPVEVGGLFSYPADGRATLLENAVIAQVPGTGDFDACWAEVWPTDDERSGLLPLALTPGADATQVRQGQLNASRGQHHDPAELYESRPTRWAGEAAVLGGLVLGFVSVRMRRLDVASALHAGVPRTALAVQLMSQSAAWAAAGMFLSLPLLWWAASGGSSSDGRETWTAAVLVVGGGAAAILSGTVLATCSIRESQLFRYFKDR